MDSRGRLFPPALDFFAAAGFSFQEFFRPRVGESILLVMAVSRRRCPGGYSQVQSSQYCRRCGRPLAPRGGVAGYCEPCARELVEGIKKLMPQEVVRKQSPVFTRVSPSRRSQAGLLYTTDEQCPVCGTRFAATRVAMSRLKAERRDPDFYVQYQPLDPNLYQVWVCPGCGYAAPQGAFAPLYPDEKERMAQAAQKLRQEGEAALLEVLAAWNLQECWPQEAMTEPEWKPGEVRSLPQALAAYLRGLYFSTRRRLAHGVAAGLLLRLAWLFRAAADGEREKVFLARALDEYLLAYEREDRLPGNMSSQTVSYLIGVLAFKLGRLKEAAHFLAPLVSPRSDADPAIRKMAQDQWADLQQAWTSAADVAAQPRSD